MDADVLGMLVRDHFREHAVEYSLAADGVTARYVLNWGGFVNFSYRVTDGRRAYHLKLAVTEDRQAPLRRWYKVRDLLVPYHAPPIVDWIELGVAAGLLFSVVPGSVPPLSALVIDALVPVLGALYGDVRLAEALREAETVTARDGYLAIIHDRLTEDLRGITQAPPPFVDPARLQWMHDETERLRLAIESSAAFDEPLSSPVHGDLWLNNIHWAGRDEWSVLDWDDMRIGDPAADLAALLGPTASDLRPLKMAERAHAALTAPQRARLPLLGRATVLDWVIDPLSDWVDAHVSATHLHEVRAEKERVHREALATYRAMYG